MNYLILELPTKNLCNLVAFPKGVYDEKKQDYFEKLKIVGCLESLPSSHFEDVFFYYNGLVKKSKGLEIVCHSSLREKDFLKQAQEIVGGALDNSIRRISFDLDERIYSISPGPIKDMLDLISFFEIRLLDIYFSLKSETAGSKKKKPYLLFIKEECRLSDPVYDGEISDYSLDKVGSAGIIRGILSHPFRQILVLKPTHFSDTFLESIQPNPNLNHAFYR